MCVMSVMSSLGGGSVVLCVCVSKGKGKCMCVL